MAKTVFRPGEVTLIQKRVVLEPPKPIPGLEPRREEAEELEEVEEYSGPTADELRREAEAFKAQWESERDTLIAAARAEAEAIVRDAEAAAFQEVKRKSDQAQKSKREAEDEAARIVAEAEATAREIEAKAKAELAAAMKDARSQGFEEGKEAGFQDGKAEADRLVERLQTVLERAQDKRAEIIAECEQQIVDLVLLIARKVVKVISENQKSVVVSNVVQALRKVRGRGEIVIRVNVEDLRLTTEHTKDFLRLIEGGVGISVVEDSSVDRGGCVIETEFGEIDAKVSSQLSEIEQKILEISPIKAKARALPVEER